jgi:hypothetical protein
MNAMGIINCGKENDLPREEGGNRTSRQQPDVLAQYFGM